MNKIEHDNLLANNNSYAPDVFRPIVKSLEECFELQGEYEDVEYKIWIYDDKYYVLDKNLDIFIIWTKLTCDYNYINKRITYHQLMEIIAKAVSKYNCNLFELSISNEVKSKLADVSARQGVTMNTLINAILKDYVD